MVVRLIDPDDLNKHEQTIERLIFECIDTTYEVECAEKLVKEKLQSLREHLKAGSAIALAAFEEQEVIGFLWGYELNTITEKVIHVGYIAVLNEFRGKGVASELLTAIQGIAAERGISTIELIVGNSNSSATHLYQKQGYYVDRLIMRKKI